MSDLDVFEKHMQILMAQLTHQNPLEPMSNDQMMSQFSQLNSLQELRDIHVAMDKVSVSNQTTYLASLAATYHAFTSFIVRNVKLLAPAGNSTTT